MTKLDKNLVKKTLAGYRRAGKIIAKQRVDKLRSLSQKESLSIYLNMYQVWENTKLRYPQPESMNKIKINKIIDLRQKLDRLAKVTTKNE